MEVCNDHHWAGLKPDPDNFFGFIYRIDCIETGHSYIGKRQMWAAKRGAKLCKSKIADKGSPRWKDDCWVEADWHYYKGSSKYLAKFMADNPTYTFTYTILKNCRSRGILVFSEAEYQWEYKVLTARLPDGQYKFFNHMIGGIKFRPRLESSLETKTKIAVRLKGNTNSKGKVPSARARAKISASMTGVPKTDKCKAKLREANLGKTYSAESRAKKSASLKGRVITEEHRIKIRESNRDKTYYTIESTRTGDIYTGTRYDLMDTCNLTTRQIGDLIRRRHKVICKQWKLKEIHES